ncbi:hypothetical protein J0H58_11630 [bacterium]|nr:hypothetical protein [bacterium]
MTGALIALLAAAAPPVPPAPVPLHTIRLGTSGRVSAECAAFTPDGKTLVVGGGAFMGPGQLLYWDVAAGRPAHTHSDHTLAVKCVAVSPDGKRVATGGGYGEVKVWDRDGRVVAHLDGHAEYTYSVAFSPDGRYLAHTGSHLVVRDTATFEPLPGLTGAVPTGPAVAFSPDSKSAVVTFPYGKLRLLSVPGGKQDVLHQTATPGLIHTRPQYAPDGKTLAVGTYVPAPPPRPYVYTTDLWEVSADGLGRKRCVFPGHHLGRAFTPDGKYLLLGEASLERKNRVLVRDVASGRPVAAWEVSGPGECVRCIAVSPNGKLAATCVDGHPARVWDLEKILPRAR